MHFRAFITLGEDCCSLDSGPEEVCSYVENYLTEEGFAFHGRFASGVCDYFSIGGRWKGELFVATLDKDKHASMWNTIKNNKVELNEKGRGSVSKDVFGFDIFKKMENYPNAAIITKEIYNAFLKEFKGVDEDGEKYWDLDSEYCSEEDFVGKKWIVVIDYHN